MDLFDIVTTMNSLSFILWKEINGMQHIKQHHSQLVTNGSSPSIIVEGPVPSEQLSNYHLHPDLDAFRRPPEQFKALIEISELPEGRIIVSRIDDTIIGYVTFHYPDEMERWSQGHMQDLIELGAIEVADDYRGLGLGKRMIRLAFEDGQLSIIGIGIWRKAV
jgi:acetoin utilization protein AcuA